VIEAIIVTVSKVLIFLRFICIIILYISHENVTFLLKLQNHETNCNSEKWLGFIINSTEQKPSEQLGVDYLIKCLPFMEREHTLPHSQQPDMGPYSEPADFSSQPDTYFFKINFIIL